MQIVYAVHRRYIIVEVCMYLKVILAPIFVKGPGIKTFKFTFSASCQLVFASCIERKSKYPASIIFTILINKLTDL